MSTTDNPYRTNAKTPEPEPALPFRERFTWLWAIMQVIVGVITLGLVVTVILCIGWLLFPGIYYIGMWFSNSVMGWNVGDYTHSPNAWFIGVLFIGVPILGGIMSKSIGAWILNALPISYNE